MAEAYRLHLVCGLEETLRDAGFRRVAGVDEVGRGCLAGPVTAAAVIVDPRRRLPGVMDSKLLNAEERERLATAIEATSIACEVAFVSAAEIDRSNILRATRAAMNQALRRLHPQPDCALIDAVALRGHEFPVVPVVRGDALSYAVAAASIVAKVARDRRMGSYDRDYPQYGFARHKGYAALQHRQALVAYGPTPIHRLTFRSVVPRLGATNPQGSPSPGVH
jgi:ribonuclease HII